MNPPSSAPASPEASVRAKLPPARRRQLCQERVELGLDIIGVGQLRNLVLCLAPLPLQFGDGLVRRLGMMSRRQIHAEHSGRSASGNPDRVLLQRERQRLDVHRLVTGRHSDPAPPSHPRPVRIDDTARSERPSRVRSSPTLAAADAVRAGSRGIRPGRLRTLGRVPS